MNHHQQYKELKKRFGWTNKDVAEITGNSYDSIKTLTQPKKEFPRWLNLALEVFKRQQDLKNQHHNRIKEVIENNENELHHFKAIDVMISNYEEMFGVSKLSNNLLSIRNKRYNLIEELTNKKQLKNE